MHRVLRVLAVVQDAVRYLVHKALVFQIYLLKLHLFLRCVEHLQIIDQHRLYLLLPGVGVVSGIKPLIYYRQMAGKVKICRG